MRKFNLPNGVHVVLDTTDEQSVAIAVMLDSGSRNDPPGLPGLHHALEHLMARVTKLFQTWKKLCGFADEFTLAFNAMTDKKTVVFYVKTESWRIRSGLKLIDQVINWCLLIVDPKATEHLVAEHSRLAEERRQANDLTDEFVDEQFDRLMLTGGLAHTIDGPIRIIKRYTGRRLRQLYHQLVVGKRITIVVTGGFNSELVAASILRRFGHLPAGRATRLVRSRARRTKPRIWLKNEQLREQIHFTLGFSTFGVSDPDRFALLVLRNYLSQRASSQIRSSLDGLGFGYSSNDFMIFFPELGQYGIKVWIDPKNFVEALRRIAGHFSQVQTELISDEELLRSKRNIRNETIEQFGDPLYGAQFMASQIAILGHFVPIKKFLRNINAVTPRQLRRVARQILVQRRLVMVAAGPMDNINKRQVKEALRFRKRKSK